MNIIQRSLDNTRKKAFYMETFLYIYGYPCKLSAVPGSDLHIVVNGEEYYNYTMKDNIIYINDPSLLHLSTIMISYRGKK